MIQQRIIIYTLFETLPIQNIKNETTQTNKQNTLGNETDLLKYKKNPIV